MKKDFLTISVVSTFVLLGFARAEELIDVGDHKLAIERRGAGSPTVVLESGAGSDIASWSVILPKIGELTSAIAYARAGRSSSEPAKTPRTLTAVVEELRTLLQRSGSKPPYVLVGRSLGGIYIRAFAMLYPTEVAGLVLVDGSHERQGIEFARVSGIAPDEYRAKLAQSVKEGKDDAARREMAGLETVLATGELGISNKLPDVPMVILTNTKPEGPPAALKAWRDLHNEVFQSTTQGMHILTKKSGHDIASKEPELVVTAVRWVVDAARQNQPKHQ